MKYPENTIEILKLLDKSNCRACGFATCLVFALAVFKGEKNLGDCPKVDPEIAKEYCSTAPPKSGTSMEIQEDGIVQLQKQISEIDLALAADRTGGRYIRGQLIIKVLGKDFHVNSQGQLSSDIHINQWVAGPVLNYVLKAQGVSPDDTWVPLRELERGKEWDNFFVKRCEEPLKKIADTYTDFFKDLVYIFNGKQVQNHYQSDVSIVLHPLPKVPLLICYWKAEEGLPSTLNLFFDVNVEKNLPIESVYTIGTGLAVMFGKLALRHG
ncbi:MAG: DUF3786 domain-containing protein [Pseudomonadota bacterium]